jgi:hypothetical protein
MAAPAPLPPQALDPDETGRALRAAFVARAERALHALADGLPAQRLGEALSAANDVDVLLDAMTNAGAVEAEVEPLDPQTAAYLRGAAAIRALLKACGGVLSAEELADHLSISVPAISKRREKNQIFWIPRGEGYAYPAFQIGPDGLLPGIRDVANALAETNPWVRLNFMLTGDDVLGGARPLDALREGDVAGAVWAAERFARHGL